MNIEELKKDYIITSSIDCAAYLLLFCSKESLELFVNEEGYNIFGIKKSSDLIQIYRNYKRHIRNSDIFGIDDLIMYNNNIRYLKRLCRDRRAEQENKVIMSLDELNIDIGGGKKFVINIDGEEFIKAVKGECEN